MTIQRLFIGRVTEDGKLEMSAPVRGLWQRHLDSLKGAPVEWTLRRHRKKRSTRANAYYRGVVVPLLAEYCGYDCHDDMHEALAFKFLRIEDCPITGSPRRKHTPETDSKEFATYVDSCIRLASEYGLWIPAPGEVMSA